MFVPQCLMVGQGEDLELTDQIIGDAFTFENRWVSGPLKEFTSSSPYAFQTSLLAILTVEIIRQKKACLGVEWLMFDQEEQRNSRDLAKSIMNDYVEFDRESHCASVSYGVNEVEVGNWLIDIINSKLC